MNVGLLILGKLGENSQLDLMNTFHHSIENYKILQIENKGRLLEIREVLNIYKIFNLIVYLFVHFSVIVTVLFIFLTER